MDGPCMPPSLMQRVPLEIWMMILRLATLDAHPTKFNNSRARNLFNDNNTAQANNKHRQAICQILVLVRVCRAWNAIARPFLFEWVVISDTSQVSGVAEALSQDPGPEQLPHSARLRRLVIDFGDYEYHQACDTRTDRVLSLDLSTKSVRISLFLLSDILRRCTMLEDFICDAVVLSSLTQYADQREPLFPDGPQDIFLNMHKTLQFLYISGQEDHTAHEYGFFMRRCPKLTELQCACTGLGEQEFIMTSPGPNPELQSLSLYCCRDWFEGRANISVILASFTTLHLSNLRQVFLLVSNEPVDLALSLSGLSPAMERFFEQYGPQLTSVGISEVTEYASIAFAVLAWCPNLHEFSFSLGPQTQRTIGRLVEEHAELRRICCTGFDDWSGCGAAIRDEFIADVHAIIATLCTYPKLELIRLCDIRAVADFGLVDPPARDSEVALLSQTLKEEATRRTDYEPYQISYDNLKAYCRSCNVRLEMDHRAPEKELMELFNSDEGEWMGDPCQYLLYNNQLHGGRNWYT